MKKPLLIVLSAPSGAGKTTLCKLLLSARPDFVYSVSCTTRPPRIGEVNGIDYHFLTQKEFDEHLAAGDFLENAIVHGHHYGTLRKNVFDAIMNGRSVLMDIDVQGAAQIRNNIKQIKIDDTFRFGFLDIFIAPPSINELKKRLLARGKDTHEVIERRLKNAELEMARSDEYKYTITNDDLNAAFERLLKIIEKEENS